jgi:hypothetical protein
MCGRRTVDLAYRHLAEGAHQAALPFGWQRLPDRTGQPIAHRVIQASAPRRTALEYRVSAVRRFVSNYQRHLLWDIENAFDELKNQWGWGGFTTQDLTRCRLLAGMIALIYNWWSLFVRLADPDHHREAITTRPLLLSAIARQTQHAGQVTLTISSTHASRDKARDAYRRIAGFLTALRKNAEQLDPLIRWYRILSEALRHFLKGRQLQPPIRLNTT